MDSIEFKITGEPQGKARPRFYNGHAVTPKQTRIYEQHVKFSYLKAGGKMYDEGGVAVEINAYFEIPKSYTHGRRRACKYQINRPTKKPDIDNIVKAIMDGLNGTAYKDDKQVISLVARKWYAREGAGYVRVRVYPTTYPYNEEGELRQ